MASVAAGFWDSDKKSLTILVVAFVVQWLATLLTVWLYGSSLGKFIWLNLKLPEQLAFTLDKAILMVITAVLVVSLHRRWAAGLWLAAIWIFSNTLATWLQGGSFGAPYSVPAHSVRYVLPVALALFMLKSRKGRQISLVDWPFRILTLAASATFVTHGLEALANHPVFKDYIIRFFREWLSIRVSESRSEHLLLLIGLQDIILGIGILTGKFRAFFLYMACWGFWTAGLRILHSPEAGGFLLVFIRVANGSVPLALYFWRRPTGCKKSINSSPLAEVPGPKLP